MKMPRSRCENENVQFVQELSEVDGPFESPININFRDLVKLELPSMVWNRSDALPRKMKITNTGHTVIISGKWKCERPYLTGGPLLGKYVFSQIHFHWGQEDCRGSEHMVCGEGFPLEMHVVHFKAEYLTQEYALREKDGMVVVVYLFKLQEEPNAGLKKILSCLPNIKQAGTSYAIDPRPILTLCNPFTDDYFLYWGSVVTTTCAHIFMWLVCREPFGISREQINEFRKILDPSQQPICRNSREPQPLHRRNVFHVNAGKNLDDPMLSIKKMMGCYCRKSEEDVTAKQPPNECCCQAYVQNQEDVEEDSSPSKAEFLCFDTEGTQLMSCKPIPPEGFYKHQSYFVHSAIIHSAPLIPKRLDSDYVPGFYSSDRKHLKPEGSFKQKLVTQSCCFLPVIEDHKIKISTAKRKPREKRGLYTIKALSQLMDSLEALKNHTFKKLKDIESINQEIKGMKSFCQDSEDKQWLRKIEQIILKQKKLTIKSSRSCFGELKKLAKECNFDRFFDQKDFPEGLGNRKLAWFWENGIMNQGTNFNKTQIKPKVEENPKPLKPVAFTEKAKELIYKFFEVIKDGEEVEKSVRNNLKKIESICSKQAGDSNSVESPDKSYITHKMFALGNFGDQFFTEVTTEDGKKDYEREDEISNAILPLEDLAQRQYLKPPKPVEMSLEIEKNVSIKSLTEEVIPLHRANVNILKESPKRFENWLTNTNAFLDSEFQVPRLDLETDSSFTSESEAIKPTQQFKKSYKNSIKREIQKITRKKLSKYLDPKSIFSSSELSTVSTDTQRMVVAKSHKKQMKKDRIFRGFCDKTCYKQEKLKNLNVEGYYYKKNNSKIKQKSNSDSSSTSKEDRGLTKWKRFTRAKFKLKIRKTSESTIESSIDYSFISPKRKKLKLQYEKIKHIPERNMIFSQSYESETETESQMLRNFQGSKSKNFQKIKKVIQDLVTESLKKQQRAQATFFEPEMDLNEVNRTTRSSSAESKVNDVEKPIIIEKEKTPKTAKYLPRKTLEIKNRSLTDLKIKTTRHTSEISQRVFVESLEERQRSAREASELKKIFLSPRIRDMFVEGVSNEDPNKINSNKDQIKWKLEKESEYKIGFLTTISCQPNQEPQALEENRQNNPETEKQKEEEIQEIKSPHQECVDRLLQSSLTEGMKGDMNIAESPKLQTSDTCLTTKKNPQSRPHSAETLHSLKKPSKRKRKKRPHCCKRSSRHYIRKNSTIFKKHPKVENKPLNFSGLSEEEQLKIISMNVAKYLKQKLVEQKVEESTLTETIVPKTEEVSTPKTPQTKPESEKQKTPVKVVKVEQESDMTKTDRKKVSTPDEPDKKIASSPKPVHNFIKLNKQMAGKYKRSATPTEKKANLLKNKEVKKDPSKHKVTAQKKNITPHRTEAPATANSHEQPEKPPATPKKSESPKITPKTLEPAEKVEMKNMEVIRKPSTSALAVQKLRLPKKRWIPAYMLTSYLPNPVNLVENQQRKMNGYFLNMKKSNMTNYIPEMLCEANLAKATSRSDSLLTKDLEYLIRLQMCLNNEISENIENSMNYVKTLLSQDLHGTAIIEKAPVNETLEEYNKGIVLIEMNNLKNSSSSSSDRIETPEKVLHKETYNQKCSLAALKESGDSEAINPSITREVDTPEENSDSSYNCEISITLNAGTNGEIQCYDPDQEGNSNLSQTLLDLKSSSQSVVMKPHRKKRKDNEISTEMKTKLLQILDREIKRELGATYGISSEASSDGLTFRWDDSDGINRSQSTDSSYDNTEVLMQISETMKEYLTDYKEKKKLASENAEKENKNESPR